MKFRLLAQVNQLQSQLGFSDANMGANARNWIDQDDELLRRWIVHLEEVLARQVKEDEEVLWRGVISEEQTHEEVS